MFQIESSRGPVLVSLPVFCGISLEEHAEHGPRDMWINPVNIQAVFPHRRFNKDSSEQKETSQVFISTTHFEVDMTAGDLVEYVIAQLDKARGAQG